MTDDGNELAGSCHCGNIFYRLRTERDAVQLPLRRCSCSFCRRTGARYTADPKGELHVGIVDAGAVNRYRFASEEVEFLICTLCGCMPAALSEIAGRTFAVINTNCLEPPLSGEADIVDFSGETPQEGETRRLCNWIGRVTLTQETTP